MLGEIETRQAANHLIGLCGLSTDIPHPLNIKVMEFDNKAKWPRLINYMH